MTDQAAGSTTFSLRRSSKLRKTFSVEDGAGNELGTLEWTSRLKDSAEVRGPDLALDLRTHGMSRTEHTATSPEGPELVTIDGDASTVAGVDGAVAWSASGRWKGIEGRLTADEGRSVRVQTRPGHKRRATVEVHGDWPDPTAVAVAAAFAALVAESQSVVVTT
ncbi:hypothetical protein [Patulibacter americanus]|uniref:hypothetical protein n=1 Tax=Patulibacter americanus TaxID=588672 RepID=UPI0003B5DFA2|nr:hypothetical protein [Patulibacter americanus]